MGVFAFFFFFFEMSPAEKFFWLTILTRYDERELSLVLAKLPPVSVKNALGRLSGDGFARRLNDDSIEITELGRREYAKLEAIDDIQIASRDFARALSDEAEDIAFGVAAQFPAPPDQEVTSADERVATDKPTVTDEPAVRASNASDEVAGKTVVSHRVSHIKITNNIDNCTIVLQKEQPRKKRIATFLLGAVTLSVGALDVASNAASLTDKSFVLGAIERVWVSAGLPK